MSKIEEKIDEAASFYGNTHAKAALHLNRNVTPFDKRIAQFDTYDLETAFVLGARFALSHQWVSVEDALPDNCNELVLVLDNDEAKTAYFKGCSKRWGSQWRIGKDDAFDSVTHWMPIPPLPEARKEEEV